MTEQTAFNSRLTAHSVDDPHTWNTTLAGLPLQHVLQAWEWGEIKRQTGWQAQRLVFSRDGEVVAAAQVLSRRLGRLPLCIQYVPKGPVFDYHDRELGVEVIAALEHVARRQDAIFLKLDPDVPVDDADGRALAALLRHRGWTYSADHIQFKNTALLDLTRSEADIQAAFKPKWRYNVRLAERKGVTVRAGDATDLAVFYRLYAETGARDGFLIRPYEYYRQTWETFLHAGGLTGGRLLLAEVDGETVAGLFVARFNRTAWYLYGASGARQRQAMPNHLLQWEAMRWAKAQGCATYDLWGAPTQLDETDALWGVWRFKEGFGAEFAPHVGAHDYPPSQWRYWVYTVVMPRVMEGMRRRRGRKLEG